MPQFLKLLFGKVIVEFVLWGLRFASVVYHVVQSLRVEDALHTLIHLFGIGLQVIVQRLQRAALQVGVEQFRHLAALGDVAVHAQLEIDVLRLGGGHGVLRAVGHSKNLAREELHIGTHRAVVEVGTDVLLQVADKRGIAFARYHRQAVHLVHFVG